MSKKCIKCGQEIPENASFCPHCTAIQTEKKEIKTPRRWKKKALTALAVLILLAAAGVAFSLYHRPLTYEGGAQIVYKDKDKSYKVLLTFSEGDGRAGNAESERTDTISEGMQSALPCQLYVLDQETGELAWEEFTEKVESCQVDTVPGENSSKVDFTEPAHNESFPDAAYVSNINYFSDNGTNDIRWTLTMKNGDTILLSNRLIVEEKAIVRYSAEDTPMETTEELRVLLEKIEEEVPSNTTVYLYLPAVTYEGDVTFGNHTWGIFGSTEGDSVTTFTGTVSVKGMNGNSADVMGIDFAGNSGIGLDAYCFVYLSLCSFEGWDTGAMARDGAWVTAVDCTFTDNQTALKFNTSRSYGSAPEYSNNTFTGNQTAVCIDNLPGNEVLDFVGSTFSGNETDIENKTNHTVNTANAVFE